MSESTRSIHEVLKEKEAQEQAKLEAARSAGEIEAEEVSLDSTERIKVLSPGQLVFKRFVNNKLAIAGTAILVFMFVFAFLVPLFYPYSQTEIFYKYDNSVVDYAIASERTEYSVIYEDGVTNLHYSIKNSLTGNIISMNDSGETTRLISDSEGNGYKLQRVDDFLYMLYKNDMVKVASLSGETKYATYNPFLKDLQLEKDAVEIDGFREAIEKACDAGEMEFDVADNHFSMTKVKKSYSVTMQAAGLSYTDKKLGADFEAKVAEVGESGSFEYKNKKYSVSTAKGETTIYEQGNDSVVAYLSCYVFDALDAGFAVTDDFNLDVLRAIASNGEFSSEGINYAVKNQDNEIFVYAKDNADAPVVAVSNFVIRAYDGTDTLEFAFKEKVKDVIADMTANNTKESKFDWDIAQVNSEGAYEYDENGNVIKQNCEVRMSENNGTYVMNVSKVVYLIDTYAAPSKAHVFGTDGDGMDVLARMMYGGRVSLLVGFVVIIIENFLGIVLGGVAGFFGGWVDNLIMRMVDIFYCIPSMPILIIMGALFDALKMQPYTRLMWLMVVMGVLGWAGVARMVRGQILSLREQEFMVAAEAIGLRTNRRIFKHLIPNVMPQLIVTATAGLGSVIITESTLSYLGLGVKHPLASWGTMINSVSTAEAMKNYTYIWVPVGLLICLTVIAFNFVGDGLRDAFDPKMKR